MGSRGSHSGQPSCGQGRGCSGAEWLRGKAATAAAVAVVSARAPPGGSRLRRGCWRAHHWAGAAGHREQHLVDHEQSAERSFGQSQPMVVQMSFGWA